MFVIISLIRESFELVVPVRRFDIILNTPDDNHILATAYETEASVVISGDRHLLDLKESEGIRVVAPAVFSEVTIGI